MRERSEHNYAVTPGGVLLLEKMLGIVFIYEPKYGEWETFTEGQRERFTAEQNTIYCPHCGSFYHKDNPYEDIAANFPYEDALTCPDENHTLEYDRPCDNCGKSYHLSVDATVELHFTTICETEAANS
jgi:uncharacterized protein YbaR (Trm112 family)